LLTKEYRNRQSSRTITHLEAIMDAKWNNVIDNMAVRLLLLVVGFGVWLVIGYGILAAA
jgi:hypothetical protein